jgi:hypothetical protein
MGALDGLWQMVKDSVIKHTSDQRGTGFDSSSLLAHLEQIFTQHQASTGGGSGGFGNVKPANQDPYGDPADQVKK